MEGITIRSMTLEDLPQVLSIESEIFSTPWSIRSFMYEVNHDKSIFKVAIVKDHVIGYICLRTLFDVTNVLNLAVSQKFLRKGVAGMLLLSAIEDNSRSNRDVKSYFLEVRSSNAAAIQLYTKFGFKVIGRRKGYYRMPDEDATIMGVDAHIIRGDTLHSNHK